MSLNIPIARQPRRTQILLPPGSSRNADGWQSAAFPIYLIPVFVDTPFLGRGRLGIEEEPSNKQESKGLSSAVHPGCYSK